jgi:endonuclease YncB( thermonuclease family)
MITIANNYRALVLAAFAAVLTCPPVLGASTELNSYAMVRGDATLKVGGRHVVRLFGIHIPSTGRTCRTNLRPVTCASRAALALDFKIQGFVRCTPTHRHRDRSITAQCRNRGVDLGAYLIERGWAVATPGAPFDYVVLERIARERNMGVWGFHADRVVHARKPRLIR